MVIDLKVKILCLKVLQEYLIQESQCSAFNSAVWHSSQLSKEHTGTNSWLGCSYAHNYALYLTEKAAFDFTQNSYLVLEGM